MLGVVSVFGELREAVGGGEKDTVLSNKKDCITNIFKPKVKCFGLCKLGACSEWFKTPSR